jgi:cell division protein FtsA
LSKKDQYIAGLDIGSTKTCALIGEWDGESLRFVSLGAAESRGLRKGQIVNLDATVGCIRRAVEEAESGAGTLVENALVGVSGSHVRGVNSRGGISLGSRPRDVTREDVKRAVEAARNISLPEDRQVLHVLRQEFFLDSHDNIRDPEGMVGQKLETNVHLVTASATATQNFVTAANRAGVSVTDLVLEPLASAEACLTPDERELGCCLVDIGGGTSELIVYSSGVVRHTSVVPIGGDHFSNDLAVGLRTPIPEAEKIKRDYAMAWRDLIKEDHAIEIASVGDRPPRTVFARSLSDIVEPRAEELLRLIAEELKRAGLERQIPAGFIFTGGGANLNGLTVLAEQMFSLPVRVGSPKGLEGMTEDVTQPAYATAVGLVLYGARAKRHIPAGGWKEKFKALFAGQGN